MLALAFSGPSVASEVGDTESAQDEPAARDVAPPETAKIVTQDAPTVDPGQTEVQFNYFFGSASKVFSSGGKVEDRGTLKAQLFTPSATRGLIDGLDATVAVAWQDLVEDDDEEFDDGIGNITVNAKWRFFQNDDQTLVLAWMPGFTAPFSGGARDKEFIPLQDFWSVDQLVVLTLIGQRFNLSLDAGYRLPIGEGRDEEQGHLAGDVAVGYQLVRWFQPVLEFNYLHSFIDDGADVDALGASAGVILNFPHGVRLDLGYQQSVYGRGTELGSALVANLSVTF